MAHTDHMFADVMRRFTGPAESAIDDLTEIEVDLSNADIEHQDERDDAEPLDLPLVRELQGWLRRDGRAL